MRTLVVFLATLFFAPPVFAVNIDFGLYQDTGHTASFNIYDTTTGFHAFGQDEGFSQWQGATYNPAWTTLQSGVSPANGLEAGVLNVSTHILHQTAHILGNNMFINGVSTLSGHTFLNGVVEPLTGSGDTSLFFNRSDADSPFQLRLVSVNWDQHTIVNPEPATWLLLLSGLGLAGVARKGGARLGDVFRPLR